MSFDVEIFAERIFVFKNIYEDPSGAVEMFKKMRDTLTEDDIFKLYPWEASNLDPMGNRQVYGEKISAERRGEKIHTSSEEIKTFYRGLHSAFEKAGKYYFEKLDIPYRDDYLADIAMFKYDPGKEMGPHVDNDEDGITNPICTGIMYLNSDKDGGDLYFKEQDVLVKSEAGTMVLFPCIKPFYHQSKLLKSGNKYHTATGWKGSIHH
jgi:hypothetical protein